ncbi:winged helix-turn-helix domain-containing protein [uncultured Methanobrevibacter sp.]|uniref:winged helix-turn-helix domain-containing protein n=1 Tax=uncultured Methanobrevibacter sp. TaxID=253161 RepID=UPI0025CCD3A9|nr:winged helix-turn-helix domain-containing protein [uncultured Methanobrevibacter sp.]
MLPDTDTPTYVNAFTYVKRSKNRQDIIKIIATSRITPSEIRAEMDSSFSLTSRALRDLLDHDIVKCMNPEARTGRVYYLTDLGLKIYNELESRKK